MLTLARRNASAKRRASSRSVFAASPAVIRVPVPSACEDENPYDECPINLGATSISVQVKGAVATITDFIVNAAVNAGARERAAVAFRDTIGVMLAGAHEPAAQVARRSLPRTAPGNAESWDAPEDQCWIRCACKRSCRTFARLNESCIAQSD